MTYFSTTEPGGNAGVNARDRIRNRPWPNANGLVGDPRSS